MSKDSGGDKIFIDTDVLIDYSKGKSVQLDKLLEKQQKHKAILFVNSIVIAEFLTDKNLNNEIKYESAKDFLSLFKVSDLTGKTGTIAGKLLREGSTLFIGDAMIAATCLENKLKLATRNKKDFKKVKGLKFLEI